MSATHRKEAGSGSTLSSLEDAKAVGPASPHTSVENRWPLIFATVASERPKLEASLQNLAIALRSGLLGRIRWDEFTRTAVLEKDGSQTELERADITRLMIECGNRGLGKISRQSFEEVVHMVAKDNTFDSAQEWLNGLEWDDTPRVERFLPDYLGTLDRPYELAVGRYWWTAMAARILFPGCKADMMPVLVGPEGVGKSTLLFAIPPSSRYCGEACLSDRSSLLVRKALGKILVVSEQLRGITRKCDADEVKTFISSPYLEVPNPSKGMMDRHPRRFVLVGTANEKDILRDPAGHRRYLPIDVSSRRIAIDRVTEDILQLWAEARQIVLDRVARGETQVDFQAAERLAADEHPRYFKEARWAGEKRLLGWLDRAPRRFSTEEALEAIGFLPLQISQREKRDMTATLRQLGYDKTSRRVPGMKYPQSCWRKV